MKRFIMLSQICRLVGHVNVKDKTTLRDWVSMAIERDQCIKVQASARRLGLSYGPL
jgi:hypothetical protein